MQPLQPAGQFPARKQHDPLALQAFQADISADASDLPIRPTAGMRFAECNDVIQLYFGKHEMIIPHVIIPLEAHTALSARAGQFLRADRKSTV